MGGHTTDKLILKILQLPLRKTTSLSVRLGSLLTNCTFFFFHLFCLKLYFFSNVITKRANERQ